MTEKIDSVLAEHAHDWFDAITARHSRRSYEVSPVRPEALDGLEAVCTSFRPYDEARVALVRTPAVDVFKGAIGTYGKVTGAPHLLVMIGSEERTFDARVGYTGEACVLHATVFGLGTCWIGGFFDAEKAAGVVELSEGERVVAVSPLGLPTGGYTVAERVLKSVARSHVRKPIEQIAPALSDEWPSWARAAVVAARLAPSAVNRQPWRFRMSDSALVLEMGPRGDHAGVTKELDCGIAMLHAHLGALAAGTEGAWTLAQPGSEEIARFVPA